MTTTAVLHNVVVQAPDGPAALALEHRLRHLSPVIERRALGRRDSAVEAPLEIEAAIRSWLDEVGGHRTLVSIDGETSTVDAAPIHHRRGRGGHVAANAGFIG